MLPEEAFAVGAPSFPLEEDEKHLSFFVADLNLVPAERYFCVWKQRCWVEEKLGDDVGFQKDNLEGSMLLLFVLNLAVRELTAAIDFAIDIVAILNDFCAAAYYYDVMLLCLFYY